MSAVLKPDVLCIVLLAAITFESTLPETINNGMVLHLDKIAVPKD